MIKALTTLTESCILNFINNNFCVDTANAETVITADQVVRGGKVSNLKTMVDKAVAVSPCVKRVFVASRTGADVPMGTIDIPLEKVSYTICCYFFSIKGVCLDVF